MKLTGFSGKIWALQYDNGEEVALLYTEKDTVRWNSHTLKYISKIYLMCWIWFSESVQFEDNIELLS